MRPAVLPSHSKPKPSRAAPWLWLALAAIVLILDQFTKQLVQGFVAYGSSTPITPWFDLVHVGNRGAAFSFLAGAGGWQRWFFTGLAAAVSIVIVVLIFKQAQQRLFCLALALILGGALGNAIDRVLVGHVVDFISLHYARFTWPAFNVADSAISVGAAAFVADELIRVWRSKR